MNEPPCFFERSLRTTRGFIGRLLDAIRNHSPYSVETSMLFGRPRLFIAPRSKICFKSIA
jgi:hypothetical protein